MSLFSEDRVKKLRSRVIVSFDAIGFVTSAVARLVIQGGIWRQNDWPVGCSLIVLVSTWDLQDPNTTSFIHVMFHGMYYVV